MLTAYTPTDCSAHEIQQKNRASNIFSGAHHDAVHPAAQVQVQQVSPDRPPTQDDAAGRPLQSYGESSGPASPFGVYHNPVGLASHWHTADMDPRSTSANEAQRHTGPLAIDRALKQQFLQSAAVVNTLQSEAAQGSAPVCSSDTMKSAVRAVSSSPPSAMPSSYPVTAAALRELHSTPLVSLIDGESRSPPRHTPLPGPAHEFVPASASRLARQALYASGNTAEGMMAGPANRAPMTLMESTWGADGALRSARYAPAGVPAGGRWDRPGEVTHPALAHAARQRLLQGSIPPGHLG